MNTLIKPRKTPLTTQPGKELFINPRAQALGNDQRVICTATVCTTAWKPSNVKSPRRQDMEAND